MHVNLNQFMCEISVWSAALDRVLSTQLLIISITQPQVPNRVFLDPKHPISTALAISFLTALSQEWVIVLTSLYSPLENCILPGGRVKISDKLLCPVQCFSGFWLWPMVNKYIYLTFYTHKHRVNWYKSFMKNIPITCNLPWY